MDYERGKKTTVLRSSTSFEERNAEKATKLFLGWSFLLGYIAGVANHENTSEKVRGIVANRDYTSRENVGRRASARETEGSQVLPDATSAESQHIFL